MTLACLGLPVRILAPGAVRAGTLYHEDFARGVGGWYLAPPTHVPYMEKALDDEQGAPAPSLRVTLPPATLNGYLASPGIPLTVLDADYTFEFSLRVEMPDAPFEAQIAVYDSRERMVSLLPALSLAGPADSSFRKYRFSFRGGAVPGSGSCRLLLGLPYTKVFREGRFFVDEVTLRSGREAEDLEFYLRPGSVEAGESVEVHLSCGRGRATLEVGREADRRVEVLAPWEVSGLRNEPMPPNAWRDGAGWPVSALIRTGSDWVPGVYVVKVDDGDRIVWDSFVVRGGPGRLCMVLPTHTDQAYNGWGGRSFYSSPAGAGVSFDRPTPSSLYKAPIQLVRWLSREGIDFGVATDDDLHARPGLFARYAGVALTWHSEYWTRSMRENLEDYLAAGGSVMSFSGNTCWWQTRVEGERLVCYKFDAGRDPYVHIDPALVTTHWDEPPVNDPPTRLLGLTWREGGMVNWSTAWTCPCAFDWLLGHGGYTVNDASHWVFAGTDLADGDSFGREYAIVGYEVDGAAVEWLDGRPQILTGGGTPPGFRILGQAPCFDQYQADSTGMAIMGILDRPGSFIFNGGTTGWCWGLPHDPLVQRVTRNLVEHLRSGGPGPSAPALRVWPNPARAEVTLELPGLPRPDRIDVYDAEGRLVAVVAAHRTTTWSFRDAEGRELPSGAYWLRSSGGRTARVIKVR